MKAKDIFGLAVRLLGLVFLYLGLYSIAQALGSDLINAPDKSDIIDGVLPIVFYLIMAGFLIRGGILIRWAYPEKSSISESLPSQAKTAMSPPEPVPAPLPAGMDSAEEKLAALVEKPRQPRAA